MRKIYFPIVCLVLLVCSTMTAWAVIPPPPVNQNLGMPDTQFQKLFDTIGADTCKRCHKPEYFDADLPQPTGIPMLEATYLPSRHHRHLKDSGNAIRDGRIAGGAEQPPFPDLNNDGVMDEYYQCLNCHIVATDADGFLTGGIVNNFRDCLNCHKTFSEPNNQGEERSDITVHHDTPKAMAGQCGVCHGYLIRSLDEGVPPATYRPSMITPWRSGKPNEDDSNVNHVGTSPGNCNFCHNAAGSTDPVVLRDGVAIDASDPSCSFCVGFGSINIYPNKENHHATGVPTFKPSQTGRDEAVCAWCHIPTYPSHYNKTPEDPDDAMFSGWGIRGCQRCHDIESLHSIEADVAGDGIIPGQEDRYNGHIGNQDNCWGCHGNNGEWQVDLLSTSLMAVGATTPQLNAMNAAIWPEGTGFDLTLVGSGFINIGTKMNMSTGALEQYTFNPTVKFTDQDGNSTVLEPTTTTATEVVVSVPATLASGNYDVAIRKQPNKTSNPLAASILPNVNVSAAVCFESYNIVVLRGTNFNEFIGGGDVNYIDYEGNEVVGSNTSVIGDGVDADRVYRWGGDMIAARWFSGCPSSVTVKNVFDSETVVPTVR